MTRLARQNSWLNKANNAATSIDHAKRHYDAHDEIVRIITGQDHVYSCGLFLRPDMT
jgi:cyclopropane fatty-acyl-phospholipid synthase-like methyltransferase